MAAYTGRLRRVVLERDRMMCVRCPRGREATDVHHRRARKMGGSEREHTNCPCNLISLCHECHRWIESNRELSMSTGWLVFDAEEEPSLVAMPIRGKRTFMQCSGERLVG